MKKAVALIAAGVLLAGCSRSPNYQHCKVVKVWSQKDYADAPWSSPTPYTVYQTDDGRLFTVRGTPLKVGAEATLDINGSWVHEVGQ